MDIVNLKFRLFYFLSVINFYQCFKLRVQSETEAKLVSLNQAVRYTTTNPDRTPSFRVACFLLGPLFCFCNITFIVFHLGIVHSNLVSE